MSYFSKFRSIPYIFSRKDRKIDYNINEATDITTRIKIVNTFNKNSIFNYNVYRIQDGERPDTISFKEYNDPKLHWVILLFNEIKNPLFEWPKNNFELSSFIEEKYKGSSIFLNVHGISRQNETPTDASCRCQKTQFSVFSYEIPENTPIKIKKNSNLIYEGSVTSFNTQNGELRIVLQSDDFSTSETRTDPNDYQEILITVKDKSNNLLTELDIKDSCFFIVNKTKDSLHHFEKNENYIDFLVPYREVLDDSYLESSSKMNQILIGQSGFYEGNFCFSETILGTYLGCRKDSSVDPDYFVTNLEYEYKENENKREILIPRKDSISSIVKTFNRLLNET